MSEKMHSMLKDAVRESFDDSKAQLILHHCFKSMKEATSLLATIAENSTASLHKDSSFACDWISQAGNLLKSLVTSVRHRGTFSVVNTSFQRLITVLLSSNSALLKSLPENWLNDLILQITSKGASITRRSAGFPLAILSIVGKSKVGKMRFYDLTMEKLFFIGEEHLSAFVHDEKELVDLPQIHAMNVIKILLLDASVGDFAQKHITRAFELCINGFKSTYFPICNASMMLFSGLTMRYVGLSVQFKRILIPRDIH